MLCSHHFESHLEELASKHQTASTFFCFYNILTTFQNGYNSEEPMKIDPPIDHKFSEFDDQQFNVNLNECVTHTNCHGYRYVLKIFGKNKSS